MNENIREIVIILLLLLANGLFAMAEMAVVASRKTRLRQMADSGHQKAQTALDLAENPDQFLATVQVGITLVGILAGAFGGATLSKSLAALLNTIPVLAPYSQAIGLGVVVLAITYLTLIIGELVPKRLALNNPERIAAATAKPMRALARLTSPVVRLLEVSTAVVLSMLGAKPSTEADVTLEEIKILIEQGTASGIVEEEEQDMIENVLSLDDRPAGMSMTPRLKIIWLDIDESVEEIQQKLMEHQYSRFPVAQGDLDNILGIVRAKDLLAQVLTNQPLDLKALLRPALFIPPSVSALRVLELFKQHRTHMALVTDEFGGIEGIVTHDDILEDIVGDFPLAGEPVDVQATRREDGSWLVDGLLPIDELVEILDLENWPEEERGDYHTVGGFVLKQVQSIPSEGAEFVWNSLRFEVVDMDGRRVDKVLISAID